MMMVARTMKTIVPVSRIAVPFQKQIVEQRVGFMLSNPIEYNLKLTTPEGRNVHRTY